MDLTAPVEAFSRLAATWKRCFELASHDAIGIDQAVAGAARNSPR
jgi:hypothetical protein